MADKKSDGGTQTAIPQEVDRIRDIIFGGQMRDYEQKFQTVQRDMERLQQELDHLAEQLSDQDNNQNKKQQNLRREMRQSDDDIRNELRGVNQRLMDEKVDRAALGELFIELGTHLKAGGSLAEVLQSLGGLSE